LCVFVDRLARLVGAGNLPLCASLEGVMGTSYTEAPDSAWAIITQVLDQQA
jgi:hypothetical protein